MTGHFVRRDLRDFQFWWLMLAALTALVVAGAIWRVEPWLVGLLTGPYMLFALAGGPQQLGSWWRTQHGLSRHYLLTLPLSHRRLFVIQHVRILMFWLPLLILVAAVPIVLAGSPQARLGAVEWTLYYGGMAVSVGLWIEMQIWMALDLERVAAYLPKNKRAWVWIRCMAVMYAAILVLSAAWFDVLARVLGIDQPGVRVATPTLVSWPGASLVIFPLALVATALWARYNARAWCVTL